MKRSLINLVRSNWGTVLVSILWAVLGVVAGPTLEQLFLNQFFVTPYGAILFLLGTLTLAVGICITVITVFINRAEDNALRWTSQLSELKKLVGLPAEIIFEPLKESHGMFYRRLSDFVRGVSTGDEIFVMTYFDESYGKLNPNETESYAKSRDEYSKALLERSAEKGITYRRIVCFSEGPDKGVLRPERVKLWQLEHCQKMLEIRQQSGKAAEISLGKAVSIVHLDIFVIRNKVAVVSLNLLDPKSGLLHTDGTLIFYSSPNAQIVDTLYRFCLAAFNDSESIKKVPEQ